MDLNEPEIENMIPADLQGAIDRLNTVEGKDTTPELNGIDEKWLLSKNRNVSHFNPIALRKAKIVYNFGLSGCNRVNNIGI